MGKRESKTRMEEHTTSTRCGYRDTRWYHYYCTTRISHRALLVCTTSAIEADTRWHAGRTQTAPQMRTP